MPDSVSDSASLQLESWQRLVDSPDNLDARIASLWHNRGEVLWIVYQHFAVAEVGPKFAGYMGKISDESVRLYKSHTCHPVVIDYEYFDEDTPHLDMLFRPGPVPFAGHLEPLPRPLDLSCLTVLRGRRSNLLCVVLDGKRVAVVHESMGTIGWVPSDVDGPYRDWLAASDNNRLYVNLDWHIEDDNRNISLSLIPYTIRGTN